MIMKLSYQKGTWKYSQSSSRGEMISLILQPNQCFQIKNNPIKLCLKYCPAFQNSLYQQIYFQSTSTQCPKLPRWSFGLIQSTSSPLPLNVKSSQAGALDLSSCYLVMSFSSITLIITREGIIFTYLHALNITIYILNITRVKIMLLYLYALNNQCIMYKYYQIIYSIQ